MKTTLVSCPVFLSKSSEPMKSMREAGSVGSGVGRRGNDLRAAQAQKLSTLLLSCFGSDSALTLSLPRVRPGTLERDLCV